MALGIKPTVDFAFKKIFGSPENVQALIGLLNAILELPAPITDVEILNPFSYQEFEDDKQKMYDSVEAVYNSSESETFNFIRAECAATGTQYHGGDTSDPDVVLYSDKKVLNAWLDLLGIRQT